MSYPVRCSKSSLGIQAALPVSDSRERSWFACLQQSGPPRTACNSAEEILRIPYLLDDELAALWGIGQLRLGNLRLQPSQELS